MRGRGCKQTLPGDGVVEGVMGANGVWWVVVMGGAKGVWWVLMGVVWWVVVMVWALRVCGSVQFLLTSFYFLLNFLY